jgi:hypothetical protein
MLIEGHPSGVGQVGIYLDSSADCAPFEVVPVSEGQWFNHMGGGICDRVEFVPLAIGGTLFPALEVPWCMYV